MLVIWVVGLPLLALGIITKYRKHLEDEKMKKYFLILYQGLKPQTYYWEFLNTFRKFLILVINVTLSSVEDNYRILIALGKL